MKVIGAGWGRTGTTTAAAALERLGLGPCLQMQTMWHDADLAAAWAAHYRGQSTDWKDVLRDFGSTVDWPGVWEWHTFADLWPDAAVLLTVRDAESWFDSVMGSIHAWTAPGEDVGPPDVAELLDRIWTVHFGGWERVRDRAWAVSKYEAHVAEVRRTCPPERLIEWQVGDGWGPLCERLDLPVPDEPLPHLNRRSP